MANTPRKLKRPPMPGAGRPQVRLQLNVGELVNVKIREAGGGETPLALYTVRHVRGLHRDDKIIILEPVTQPEQEPHNA